MNSPKIKDGFQFVLEEEGKLTPESAPTFGNPVPDYPSESAAQISLPELDKSIAVHKRASSAQIDALPKAVRTKLLRRLKRSEK